MTKASLLLFGTTNLNAQITHVGIHYVKHCWWKRRLELSSTNKPWCSELWQLLHDSISYVVDYESVFVEMELKKLMKHKILHGAFIVGPKKSNEKDAKRSCSKLPILLANWPWAHIVQCEATLFKVWRKKLLKQFMLGGSE